MKKKVIQFDEGIQVLEVIPFKRYNNMGLYLLKSELKSIEKRIDTDGDEKHNYVSNDFQNVYFEVNDHLFPITKVGALDTFLNLNKGINPDFIFQYYLEKVDETLGSGKLSLGIRQYFNKMNRYHEEKNRIDDKLTLTKKEFKNQLYELGYRTEQEKQMLIIRDISTVDGDCIAKVMLDEEYGVYFDYCTPFSKDVSDLIYDFIATPIELR